MRNLCSKMFTDVNIKYPIQNIKNCCKSDDYLTTDFDLVFNKEYMRRKMSMIEHNELPVDGCTTCINTAPNNLMKVWNIWDDTVKVDPYHDDFTLYEFVLSSLCDLKCVYCSAKDSSSWAKELGEPVYAPDPLWKAQADEAIITHLSTRTWDKNTTYWFFFSGGEITYNQEGLEHIETILNCVSANNIAVVITTNINTKPKLFKRLLNYIDNTPNIRWMIHASIDCTGERAEAIRYGLNWNRALDNLCKILEKPNIELNLAFTLNLFSVPYLKDDIEYYDTLFKRYGKPLHINQNFVQNIGYTAAHLPPEYQEDVEAAIEYVQGSSNIHQSYAEYLTSVKQLIGTEFNPMTPQRVRKRLNYLQTNRSDINYLELFPHLSDII